MSLLRSGAPLHCPPTCPGARAARNTRQRDEACAQARCYFAPACLGGAAPTAARSTRGAQATRSALSSPLLGTETFTPPLPPSLPPSLLLMESDEHLDGHAHEQAAPTRRDARGRRLRQPVRFPTRCLTWRRRRRSRRWWWWWIRRVRRRDSIHLAPSFLRSDPPTRASRGQPRLRLRQDYSRPASFAPTGPCDLSSPSPALLWLGYSPTGSGPSARPPFPPPCIHLK